MASLPPDKRSIRSIFRKFLESRPYKRGTVNKTCKPGRLCDLCKKFYKLQDEIARANHAPARDRTDLLRQTKRDLGYEINQTHDVLNTFPVEIRSLIFEFCCGMKFKSGMTRGAVAKPNLTLTSICRSWRHVALRTPQLWTIIPAYGGYSSFVLTWIQRAGDLPLSFVSHHNPDICFDDLSARYQKDRLEESLHLLTAHHTRVCTLDMTTKTAMKPFRRTLESTPWPNLTQLMINDWPIHYALKVLGKCMQLTDVSLANVYLDSDRISDHEKAVRSPALKSLSFKIHCCPHLFLGYLSTPNLTMLDVSVGHCCHDPIAQVTDFLKQSGCSLMTLGIEGQFALNINTKALHSLLRSQPFLHEFVAKIYPPDFSSTRSEGTGDHNWIMSALLTNSRGEYGVGTMFTTGPFLPHLECLVLCGVQTLGRSELSAIIKSHEHSKKIPGARPLKYLRLDTIFETRYGHIIRFETQEFHIAREQSEVTIGVTQADRRTTVAFRPSVHVICHFGS